MLTSFHKLYNYEVTLECEHVDVFSEYLCEQISYHSKCTRKCFFCVYEYGCVDSNHYDRRISSHNMNKENSFDLNESPSEF